MNYRPIVIPRNKKYGNNYWETRGLKVGNRDVTLYSDLEFDHWLTVESDRRVQTYCEQPCQISFVLNGKLRTSIFDMVICDWKGSTTFIEVKYENELISSHKNYERNMRQIEAQMKWCNQNGVTHEVRTEKTIRKGKHSIENYLKMISNVLNHQQPGNISLVSQVLESQKSIKISKLQVLLQEQLDKYNTLLSLQWLYYEGIVTANLDVQVWGDEMEVRFNENPIR
ncbi:MAG: Tn7 transposase TnsA N-terminal domain-containing protein [Candidatus Pristimantibacillus sp.]